MSDTEKQAIIDRLQEYEADFSELLDMLQDLPLRGEVKSEAQEKMKALKERLKAEYKEGDTVRGREAMNHYEQAFLYPAIHQAYAGIHVAWNSVPSDKWHSELYSGRIDITHMLHQLSLEPAQQ
jgi:hypothetical protein